MAGSSRIFTFEEARRLVPQVRGQTESAIQRLRELSESSDAEGVREPEADRSALEEAAATILHEWAASIEELGIEVKGPWLVDFDSGAGYYCWRWPEESLEYFHDYEAGFAGRIPIQ
jgi:hypothetical protein